MTSVLRSEDPRIDVATADGRVVVSVSGSELFDLIDDHVAELLSDNTLPAVIFPSDTSQVHKMVFPEGIDAAQVRELLALLSDEQIRMARAADDAT